MPAPVVPRSSPAARYGVRRRRRTDRRRWIRRDAGKMADPTEFLHVLVAGGGVAGLEALLALRDLAGDRVELSLLTPERDFLYRPMAVAAPFGRGHAQRHAIDDMVSQLGVTLVQGRLHAVDAAQRVAYTD